MLSAAIYRVRRIMINSQRTALRFHSVKSTVVGIDGGLVLHFARWKPFRATVVDFMSASSAIFRFVFHYSSRMKRRPMFILLFQFCPLGPKM